MAEAGLQGEGQQTTTPSTGQAAQPIGPAGNQLTVTKSFPWSMVVVLAALLAVTVGAIWVLVVYESVFQDPTDVTSLMGSWFTVVGTLVGAYFGIKTSSDTTDKTLGAIETSNNTTNQALAHLPPQIATSLVPGTQGTPGT
jgi:hypothetical protein